MKRGCCTLCILHSTNAPPSTPAPNNRSWSENTPSPPLPPIPGNSGLQPSAYPTTPAYPSYPNDGLTPRPQTALPSFGQMSSVMGPNLTARQDIEFSTLQNNKGAGASNGFASSQSSVANVILSVSVVPILEKARMKSFLSLASGTFDFGTMLRLYF